MPISWVTGAIFHAQGTPQALLADCGRSARRQSAVVTPFAIKAGNRISRYALRVHAVLICLGICLPAAIGRAADSDPADNAASGPTDSQRRDGGDQPVTSPESVVRRPVRHSIAPWADPPHDSSVAPRPRRLKRPLPNQAL